jgi:hypothetical protein
MAESGELESHTLAGTIGFQNRAERLLSSLSVKDPAGGRAFF